MGRPGRGERLVATVGAVRFLSPDTVEVEAGPARRAVERQWRNLCRGARRGQRLAGDRREPGLDQLTVVR
jgi:hypothetical protein